MKWKENMTEEEFNKALQAEGDRVRTEYSKKIKALEEKLPVEKSEKEIELEKKEKLLLAKEREYQIKDQLQEQDLPLGLAKYLALDDDNDIEEISNILNQHLLNQSHKPTKKNSNNNGITKEQFKKMSYAERAKILETNEELYKKLNQ